MLQYIDISIYCNTGNMSKIIPIKLSKKEYNHMLNLLYSKMSKLNSKQKVADFLSDLLTESEQVMILRRLQIAKLLLEGKTYYEIRMALGVGISTIKNVRHKLDFGNGGYINFIKKL